MDLKNAFDDHFDILGNFFKKIENKKSTYKDKECPSASRPDWLEKLVAYIHCVIFAIGSLSVLLKSFCPKLLLIYLKKNI